jgi:hypothetical protein
MNQDIQIIIDELPIKCYDNINHDKMNNNLVCSIRFGYTNYNFRFDHITILSRLLWKILL